MKHQVSVICKTYSYSSLARLNQTGYLRDSRVASARADSSSKNGDSPTMDWDCYCSSGHALGYDQISAFD